MSPRDHDDTTGDATPPAPRGGRSRAFRVLVAAQILVAIVVVIVIVVMSQDSGDESSAVTTEVPAVDIAEVSTETLESLVAQYADDPEFADELPGVRLVLAERYFDEGAYDEAFPLYAAIFQDERAQPGQAAVALARVAWIGWLSNGDTALAIETLDRSLQLDPANAETIYTKGQLLWCGQGDATAAIPLFEQVMRATDLTDAVRVQVQGDLDAARSGSSCS